MSCVHVHVCINHCLHELNTSFIMQVYIRKIEEQVVYI